MWDGKHSYYCEKTDGGESCQLFYEEGFWYLGPNLGMYPDVNTWFAFVKGTAASSSTSLSPLESGLAEAKWTDVSKEDQKKYRAITIEAVEKVPSL